MNQDPVKHTKLITLVAFTLFLGISSLMSLVFIIKLRNNPDFFNKNSTDNSITKESTQSIDSSTIAEEIENKNITDVNFEDELKNIKENTLIKIQNIYNENELDEF